MNDYLINHKLRTSKDSIQLVNMNTMVKNASDLFRTFTMGSPSKKKTNPNLSKETIGNE